MRPGSHAVTLARAGLGSGSAFRGSGVTGWSLVNRTSREWSIRGSTRVGMMASESALIAPGTTLAYGAGVVRSNRFAGRPAAVGTESSTRLYPGMESALRAPAGTTAYRT